MESSLALRPCSALKRNGIFGEAALGRDTCPTHGNTQIEGVSRVAAVVDCTFFAVGRVIDRIGGNCLGESYPRSHSGQVAHSFWPFRSLNVQDVPEMQVVPDVLDVLRDLKMLPVNLMPSNPELINTVSIYMNVDSGKRNLGTGWYVSVRYRAIA